MIVAAGAPNSASATLVGLIATLTPAAYLAALVADFNEHTGLPITASSYDDVEGLFVYDDVGVKTTAATSDLSGVGSGFSSATFYGGAEPGVRRKATSARLVSTNEVATSSMHYFFDFTPTLVEVRVYDPAAPGIDIAWDGTVAIDGGQVTLVDGGSENLTTDYVAVVTASDVEIYEHA